MLLLLLLASLCTASPPRNIADLAIPGLEELLFHDGHVEGLRHKFSLSKEGYDLHYDVVHAAPTHSLYDASHVDAACTASSLELSFATPSDAAQFATRVQAEHIVAGHVDACGHVLRRVVGVHASGSLVTLRSEDIDLTEAFEHAEVHFESSPLRFMTHDEEDGVALGVTSSRKRWDWLDGLWSSVSSFLSGVGRVASKVYQSTQSLWSGDIGTTKTFSKDILGYNYNSATKKAAKSISLGSGITCDRCFANLNVNFVFKLSIKNYVLKTLEAYMQGTATLSVGAAMTGSTRKEYSKALATLKAPPLTFSIGAVPVLIRTTLPITGGVIFQTKVTSKITAYAKAEGTIKLGMAWNPSRKRIETIQSQSYSSSGRLALAQSTAKASLYLQCLAVFDINLCGGPNVALRAYTETSIEASSKECAGKGTTAGARGSVNLGLQVSIGAKLSIAKVISKELEPALVYETMRQVSGGCLVPAKKRSNSDPVLEPRAWLTDAVWSGFQSRVNASDYCLATYPEQVEITLQVLEFADDGRSGLFMLAGNSVGDSNSTIDDLSMGHCMYQHYMNATIDWNRGAFQLDSMHDPSPLDYTSCEDTRHSIHASLQNFAFTDGFMLKGLHPDGCVQTILEQQRNEE